MTSVKCSLSNEKIKIVMEIQDLTNKIQLKIKKIQLEKDYEKRKKYQNDLEVLKLKKEIELLKNRIKQKLGQR